jgi:hypothetical protein
MNHCRLPIVDCRLKRSRSDSIKSPIGAVDRLEAGIARRLKVDYVAISISMRLESAGNARL